MTNIKFKEREETNAIHVSFNMADVKADDFEKVVKRSGWFSIGYHYLIHPNGEVEVGLPKEVHADPYIEGWKNSICVLIMGQPQGSMTELQELALKSLQDTLGLPLKE